MLIDALTFTLRKSEALDPVWDALDEGREVPLEALSGIREPGGGGQPRARRTGEARTG